MQHVSQTMQNTEDITNDKITFDAVEQKGQGNFQ